MDEAKDELEGRMQALTLFCCAFIAHHPDQAHMTKMIDAAKKAAAATTNPALALYNKGIERGFADLERAVATRAKADLAARLGGGSAH